MKSAGAARIVNHAKATQPGPRGMQEAGKSRPAARLLALRGPANLRNKSPE